MAIAPVFEALKPQKVLMTASGGCIALSLKDMFPHADFTLYDMNPAQIEHVKNKIQYLLHYSPESFSVDRERIGGINDRGNFERLFRVFRQFLGEFVIGYDELLDAFLAGSFDKTVFSERYWDAAFQIFNDTMLNSMFGVEATQHADPQSYIAYFKGVIEKGLSEDNIQKNYFLHHIFLGHYLIGATPPYLKKWTAKPSFSYINTHLGGIEHFGGYDLIDFSNIFDWCDNDYIDSIANRCNSEMSAGSAIVFRQLNNTADLRAKFGKCYDFSAFNQVKTMDMFYNKYSIGIKK